MGCSKHNLLSDFRFFSILIVYFIVGAVVMKFVKKAEGKEIIPNLTFWKAVPVLVKVSLYTRKRSDGIDEDCTGIP